MANTTLDEIIEEAKALAPEEQQQLTEMLDRFGHLLARHTLLKILISLHLASLNQEELQEIARHLLAKEQSLLPSSERESLAQSVKGKYAHIQTSSERFTELKQAEIKREDSRR